MFIRTKGSKLSPRKSIQIVENIREGDKVRQHIIRYVGVGIDDQEEERLKILATDIMSKIIMERENKAKPLAPVTQDEVSNYLKKRGRKPKKNIEDVLPVEQVTLNDIKEESRIIDGVHEVCGKLYEQLGYNDIMHTKTSQNILKDLVLSRISNPQSKFGTSRILKRYYMKDHNIDSIYRTMDYVADSLGKIQKISFDNTTSLLPRETQIVLFDVTTLHFESTDVDKLRDFGYSKNCRFNTTQVVLALACTLEGLPIGYELFKGNKAEVKTLVETLDSWKEKFDIKDACFIGDRAMFSDTNLRLLDDRGYKYIIAAKLRTLPQVMQQKIMQDDYVPKLVSKDIQWVKTITYNKDDLDNIKGSRVRYESLIQDNKSRKIIVSYSAKRAKHDNKKREAIIEKISDRLSKTSDAVKLSRSHLKKFTSSQDKAELELDQDKIKKDQEWDGIHGVITNLDKDPVEILSSYKNLVKIEDCFRVNKHTLKMRPIYHFKESRIRAHIAICFIAFAIINTSDSF